MNTSPVKAYIAVSIAHRVDATEPTSYMHVGVLLDSNDAALTLAINESVRRE